jgi:cation transport regulator
MDIKSLLNNPTKLNEWLASLDETQLARVIKAATESTKEEVAEELRERPKSSREKIRKMIDELPVHAQDIWIGVFNSSKEYGKSDEYAARAAWSAVKEQYKKTEDGKWVRKD